MSIIGKLSVKVLSKCQYLGTLIGLSNLAVYLVTGTLASLSSLPFSVPFAWGNSGDNAIRLPELKTDEDKLAFLLKLKESVPKLFFDAAKYDIDLFKLLDDEAELNKRLMELDEYKNLFHQRKFLKLTITPKGDGVVFGIKTVRPEAVTQWQASLESGLAGLGDLTNPATSDILENAVKNVAKYEIQKKEEERSPTGKLIGSIVPNVPGHLKRNIEIMSELLTPLRARKAPREEELDALIQGFEKFQKLKPGLKSQLENARNRLREMKRFEMEAGILAVLQSQGKLNSSWEEAKSVFHGLNQTELLSYEEDLEHGRLPNAVNQIFPKMEIEVQKALVRQIYKRQFEPFTTLTVTTTGKAKATVNLEEVPPSLGIFRGCTGGDCSSQYSFPYPNDPHERVFFIKNAKGDELKGYVQTTEVLLQYDKDGKETEKKGLYVITISGNHVSAEETEVILRGLEEAKEKLGVDHILLPTSDHIASLMNFLPIRGIYEYHTKGRENRATPITYQDQTIRKLIEQFGTYSDSKNYKSDYNSGQYDRVSSNETAIPFDIIGGSGVKVEDHEIVVPRLDAVSLSDTSNVRSEILEFLLDLRYSKRELLKTKIMDLPKVSQWLPKQALIRLFNSLQDCNGNGQTPLTVDEYERELRSLMSAFGLAGNFLDTHEYLIYPAITKCSDAFTAKAERVAPFFLKDLKENIYQNLAGIKWDEFIQHRPILLRTKVFIDFVNQKLLDLESLTETDENRSKSAQALAKVAISEPKVKEVLTKALAHDTSHGVRTTICQTIDEYDGEDIQMALLKALKSSSNELSHCAENKLAGMQSPSSSVSQALAKMLKIETKEDENAISAVVRVIKQVKFTDPKGLAIIVELLKEPYYKTEKSVVEVLEFLNPEDFETRAHVLKLLSDPERGTRSKADGVLTKWNPVEPQMIEEIFKLLRNHDDPLGRASAAHLLGGLNPIGHASLGESGKDVQLKINLLLATLLDPNIEPNQNVRAAAASALQQNQFKLSLSADIQQKLILALNDPDANVRSNVAEAVLATKPNDLSLLLALLKQRDNKKIYSGVGQCLLKIVAPNSGDANVDPDIILPLTTALLDPLYDAGFELSSALIATKSKDPKLISTLVRGLGASSKNESQRSIDSNILWVVGNLLAGMGNAVDFNEKYPQVLPALYEIIRTSNDGNLFSYAIDAVSKIGARDPAALSQLIETMYREDLTNYTRSQVAQALGEINPTDPIVFKALVKAKNDFKQKNQVLKEESSRVLENMKPNIENIRVKLNMMHLLNDDDVYVRSLAAAVLKRSQGKLKLHPKVENYISTECKSPISQIISESEFNRFIEELKKIEKETSH